MAIIYNNLGFLYECMGDYEQALSNHNTCFDIRKKLFEKDMKHQSILVTQSNIARVQLLEGEIDNADKLATVVLSARKEKFGADSLKTAVSYVLSGRIERAKRNFEASLTYLVKALKIRESSDEKDSGSINECYKELAITYYEMNRNVEDINKAAGYIDSAFEFYRNAYGENNSNTAEVIYHRGLVKLLQNKKSEAMTDLTSAYRIYAEVFGKTSARATVVLKKQMESG